MTDSDQHPYVEWIAREAQRPVVTDQAARKRIMMVSVAVQPRLPVSRAVVDTVVKFVFVAPQASKVSVVGDFNGWNATTTPMVRTPNSAVWTVTLPLTTGRHVYSFVVDGSSWIADPAAPLAPDDGFGHASSVRIVGRGSAL